MELRQLKYFRAVASTLNFSKAAEHLHIAQPPLSRQIQQLESELGVQLLDRSSRPMKLTNAGVFLYEQSIRLLERIEAIQNETRRLGSEARRWMGIGFAPSILYGFIPNAIRQFSLDNENIEISLLELTSVQQAEALKAGRIDIGFGRLMIEDEALENILLTEEPLIAALPAYSPLAAERCIPLERLFEEVLVLYPASPRPSFIDQVLQQFTAKGYKIGKTLETNGLQTAIGLVAAGMGVTLVPKSVQRLRRDDVTYRPVSDRGLSAALIMTMRTGDTSDHVMKFRAMIIGASTAKPRFVRSKKP
ncbi:LysR family transcriptional regulator [Azotobacter beijerinckii]|uniref:LysR family transcriptional regulator n=1 Tax=Azotobacter beijerinckii TaxID=170623 RepID=UPI00295474D4|nr:LysR family transcriptional regulator [Azotobacter beijerinckii]MDV7211409.1 LysR family transcriptional regulator [Azotobacter beijerinckii]